MYGYIKGIVKEIDSNYIVIDNHDIGYIIYVPNPYYYQINNSYTVYTYTHIREDEYSAEVDLFKSDCLRFYKANPQFMDKYLGAMKQANTSSAKSCFEDYVDYAEANNAWSENAIEDSEKVPLGVLFRKQISCIDDYTVLKKYFDQWAKDHDLEYERTQKRIPGLKGNPIMQPLVSKEVILKLYN